MTGSDPRVDFLPVARATPRATFRATPRGPERGPADALKRTVCAELFAGNAVESVRAHRVSDRFAVEPHDHPDLLQFDLIEGCGGEVTAGPHRRAVAGVSLMVAYPGVRHGYVLRPLHAGARVCLFRLRVRPPGARTARPLAELQTGLPPLDHLAGLIAAAAELWTPHGAPLSALAKLAEAVCAWPAGEDTAGLAEAAGQRHDDAPFGDAVSDRIRRAVAGLARRHHDPPGLEELARAASVSPRHFARRFVADFGCTPHEYVTARRVDAARSKLLAADAPVARVADELGFSTPAAFARWFARQTGQTPKAFRAEPGVF